MSYLKDFLKYIASHDYPTFLKIWEEYCAGDEPDAEELIQVLKSVKNASFSELFGKEVTKGLPLLDYIKDEKQSYEIFKLIVDLDTTQDISMGERVFQYLEERNKNDKYFKEKIRLIGFRNKEKFQGAIRNYELLSHINKGKFVFHTAGWGVGVILEYSLIREQLSLEFDYVAGKKDLSFEMALKTLVPLPDHHFLAERFGDPDALEKKAKENPVEVIHMLLRDLGAKTASEIKDELCELVIPAEEWTKWWQNTRTKIKKDTMIETPKDLQGSFRLRDAEVPHEERLQKALESKPDASTLIQMVYSFLKDFPETLKKGSFKTDLCKKLNEMLSYPELSASQKLQILFFLQDLQGESQTQAVEEIILQLKNQEDALNLLQEIQILAFKKRVLVEIRNKQTKWQTIFLEIFLSLDQSSLRDYVLSELLAEKETESSIKKKLEELLVHPSKYPEIFVWYFQKIMASKKVPFSDAQGKLRFFESFLILLSRLEFTQEHKELIKKMHALLTGGRYAVIRNIMQEASVEEVKEFLLLATKCHSLDDHDIKIFHSLAEVAHPSLSKKKAKGSSSAEDELVIWTTEAGYLKLQERIKQIATIETVENAKEIETARAHGDLRENAEFKAALEKRDRLQAELKLLSDQLGKARILTSQDIATNHVGVGSIVTCQNSKGEKISYTLLGPWDADPDKNILAFQSKLAKTMQGCSVGDKFEFQGMEFTIIDISRYL